MLLLMLMVLPLGTGGGGILELSSITSGTGPAAQLPLAGLSMLTGRGGLSRGFPEAEDGIIFDFDEEPGRDVGGETLRMVAVGGEEFPGCLGSRDGDGTGRGML